MKVLVTGGAGFIGSHMAEHFALQGNKVTVYDNLSRNQLVLAKSNRIVFQWEYLKKYTNIELVQGDIRNFKKLSAEVKKADAIIHCAAQTAVTTSMVNPRIDFEINALGTFNVLEAARLSSKKPKIIYCSTNKVYGKNVNDVPVAKNKTRYTFRGKCQSGINESFPIDHCEHSPYGCSKLTGDIYMQDYAERSGLKIAVFRMSCVYGTRQFGFADQGWITWFVIAALTGKPVTVFGDGYQVRDVLYISDLVNLFDSFIKRGEKAGIYNIGGGPSNVLSLRELINYLQKFTGKKFKHSYADWRPSDQKVYISNISKAEKELAWRPKVKVEEGLRNTMEWITEHKELFD